VGSPVPTGPGATGAGDAPFADTAVTDASAAMSAAFCAMRCRRAPTFPFTGGFPSAIALRFAFRVATPFCAITRCALNSFTLMRKRVARVASLALASANSGWSLFMSRRTSTHASPSCCRQ
jgi:hypothetical protein